MDYKSVTENIRKELKTYLIENNIGSLVMGISGGIDSALCAALAKPVCDELNIPLIGRSLPTNSNTGGENTRAQEIGKFFCTDFKEVEIQDAYNALHLMVNETGEQSRPIQNGNIKARTRMIYLYDLASVHRGMVLSTDNYTELLLGFWTLHGDVGDYGMVQELWKTEVYELSEWIVNNELIFMEEKMALQNCIECNATDGLGISNSDLDQIMPGWEGSSRDGYKKVDEILQDWVYKAFEDVKHLEDNPVVKRHERTHFKRNNPFNIKRDVIVK